MGDGLIRISSAELEADEGVWISFSDRTQAGFVVEELLELRPHREPIDRRRITTHGKPVVIRNANALNNSSVVIELSDGRSMALTLNQVLSLKLPVYPNPEPES